MKKTMLILLGCNIVAISMAGQGARVVRQFGKGAKGISDAANKRNAATGYAQSSGPNFNISPELPSSVPGTPATIPVGTPPPITYGSRKEALAANKARLAEQGKNSAPAPEKSAQLNGSGNGSSQGSHAGGGNAQDASTLHKMSTFDKAYLGGTFAAVAAIFGYDALKNEEAALDQPVAIKNEDKTDQQVDSNSAQEPLSSSDRDVVETPKSVAQEEQQIVQKEFSPQLDNANSITDIASQLASAPAPSEQQLARTWTSYIKQYGYDQPTSAIMQACKNPTAANIGNALMDPVVAGTLLATAAGSFLYYQYMKYAATQVKKAEVEKEASK